MPFGRKLLVAKLEIRYLQNALPMRAMMAFLFIVSILQNKFKLSISFIYFGIDRIQFQKAIETWQNAASEILGA